MATNGTIYTGYWVNWSHGKVLGATFTLSQRDGIVLNAFLAILLSFTGTQLWKILVYAFHQLRYKAAYVDGLEHQQRLVLRNSTTPGSVAWSLLLQSVAWGKPLRTLPLALGSLLYLVAVAALSVSVPTFLRAADVRLLVPTRCGYPTNITLVKLEDISMSNWLKRSQAASLHSQSCYETASGSKCENYPVINTSFTKNASCPFVTKMCQTKNNSVPLLMTTRMIDSREDLGINLPDSVSMRSEITCSLLVQDNYTTSFDGQQVGVSVGGILYNYGDGYYPNASFGYVNITRMYPQPYGLDVLSSEPGNVNSNWDPIPEPNRTDADVTLIMFNSNYVQSMKPIDDPMFSSHDLQMTTENPDINMYMSDNWGAIIGCTNRYQLCKSHDGSCSKLLSLEDTFSRNTYDQLGLSETQRRIGYRLLIAVKSGLWSTMINLRGYFALRASDSMFQNYQTGLPSDQYLREWQGWYTTGLSAIQMSTREFIAADRRYEVKLPETDSNMCSAQLTLELGDTISFSVLYLLITVILCLIIDISSYSLEPFVNWWQSRAGYQRIRPALWRLDDVLQLQRFLFENLGYGKWESSSYVPTTSDQRFGEVDFRQYRDPRFTGHVEVPQVELEDMSYDTKVQSKAPAVSYTPLSSAPSLSAE